MAPKLVRHLQKHLHGAEGVTSTT